MANNQKKLKAFVRYDGSGRVVAGSLILRKNKPRVGRWFEIPTYQCCNGDTSTTTSTTTATPTTTTTTTSAPSTTTTTTTAAPEVRSFGARLGSTANQVCAAGPDQSVYSVGPYDIDGNPQNGTILYIDNELMEPVTDPFVKIATTGALFDCTNGVLSNESVCPA
jgi:hypothetical protein